MFRGPAAPRSFHPLYRGTWFPTQKLIGCSHGAAKGFHPLYRGTWFPTAAAEELDREVREGFSIRYIAVLGSQPLPEKHPV